MLKNRDMRATLVMGSCFAAPFATVGGLWAGPYLRDVHGLDQTEAGYVLLVMVLAQNLGTFFFGPLDRIFNTRKWVVLASAASTIALLFTLALLSEPPLWLALGLLGLFSLTSPFFVILAAHCRGFVPDHLAGRAITAMGLVGVGMIFVAQWATGLIVDAANGGGEIGYRLVFASVAALVTGAALIYLRVRDIPPMPERSSL